MESKRKGNVMKKFCVAYIDWFSYDLQMKIIEAKDLKESYKICYEEFVYKNDYFFFDKIKDLPEDRYIEEIKYTCLNQDCMISSIEIK